MGSKDPFMQAIISCCHTVVKELGFGFSKDIYANALGHELRKGKLNVAQGQILDVFYDGVCVGTSKADLIVEERIIVAVSDSNCIDEADIAQCRNDMKAACLVTGLLVSFGKSSIEVRKVGVDSEEGAEHWVTEMIKVE